VAQIASRLKQISTPSPIYRDKSLSYTDIELGLSILVKYAKQFDPQFIFGINRGGAIVGGLLAKQLDGWKNLLPNIILLHVDNGPPPSVIEQRHDAAAPLKFHRVPQVDDLSVDDLSNVRTRARALLVDDIGKTGSHMTLAYEYLREHHPCIEVRRLVMLRAPTHAQGIEPLDKRNPKYDIFPFQTDKTAVLLPWDPHPASGKGR
jgi:hypoxanthine phosphoribosyltransferase